MSGASTRSASAAAEANKDPHWAEQFFGELCEVNKYVLPSHADLIKHYYYKKPNGDKKIFYRELAMIIFDIWFRSAFPSILKIFLYLSCYRYSYLCAREKRPIPCSLPSCNPVKYFHGQCYV